MNNDFQVSLETSPRYQMGEPVIVTFELTNVGSRDYALLRWNTPLEGEVFQYFNVRRDGFLVPYDGRFVKRGDPDESAYRIVRAGETVVEQLDLSTAFPLTEPGTYTVTLAMEILDAVPDVKGGKFARSREEQQGFKLDGYSATFELVPDGSPRATVAAMVRGELGKVQGPRVDVIASFMVASPVLIGGTASQQAEVRAAHENAAAHAQAAARQLETPGASTALCHEWFGAFDATRYATVRQHFTDISRVIASETVTYDLTGAGCQADWYAYTYAGTRKVWMCSSLWSAPATGTDSKFGTVVHELSHAVSSTDDFAYGQAAARNLAATNPANAIRNADNHEYFAETYAARLVTAPVVWNNGKVYFFTAGEYYSYDIAADRVDPGYPRSISSGWPGLFADRVDAGVVWPNGKAYFFRGSEYVRYDIASDAVDPGYPQPIIASWLGLWPSGVDAAIMWPGAEKAYFFSGSDYARYDVADDQVDAGYPLPISPTWPGLWPANLTGDVVWNDAKAFFFRGQEYVRYDIAADKVDDGYPLPINPQWPGLP